MEDHNLTESVKTLPASMEAAHVDVWTKINESCFIAPAIDRLNSLQDKGFFERRKKAFDDQRESVDHFTPAMTPTPFVISPLLAEAQPAVDSSPKVPTSQPHDPVIERIEEILGVVGIHEIILGEQVAGTISLLEKTTAHVRRLHEQALLDITDAAQALRRLRHDLTQAKPSSISPHQDDVASSNAGNNSFHATSAEPSHTSLEGGHTVVAPVTRVVQEHNEDLNHAVPTVLVDNKQAEDKRKGEGACDNSCGSQQCESYGFAAQAQHQPRPQPSGHGDGTLASPANGIFSTGSEGRYPPSAEQKQLNANDLKNMHQGLVQHYSEHTKGTHDMRAAASGSKTPYRKTSSLTSVLITARPVKNSKSRDTAVSPTSSAQNSSNDDTRLFSPVSPPSGGMQPYVPESAIPESVRSSEDTPQSILRTGPPLVEAQISAPDEENASIHQGPSELSPIVKESDVLPTKGIKRRSDNTTDLGRKRTRQRIS